MTQRIVFGLLLLQSVNLACVKAEHKADAAVDAAIATGCPEETPAPGSACSAGEHCGPYLGALHADCEGRCPSGCTGGGPYSVSIPAYASCQENRWVYSLSNASAGVCNKSPTCSCPGGRAGEDGASGKGGDGSSVTDAGT